MSKLARALTFILVLLGGGLTVSQDNHKATIVKATAADNFNCCTDPVCPPDCPPQSPD